MAGGFWVLGGIIAAPIVFFSTKSAYKKVDILKEKILELTEESEKVLKLAEQASGQLGEARKQLLLITALIKEYVPRIKDELRLYKLYRSFWRDFFGCKMNSDQQRHYENMNNLANELLDKLGIR